MKAVVPNPTLPLDFTVRPPEEPAKAPALRKPADDGPRVMSVAELDRAIRRSLEEQFAIPVWVEGEVAGARPAPSGHMYFALKDEREEASIDVAMYKMSLTPRSRALIVDGARIRLRGRPSFWAPRGRLQFIADRAEPVGRGALLEALERLKTKLQSEGLFAPERKRALPAEPRVVGVITSKAGAAIHDICKVAFCRGGARVLLAPAQVQGAGAAESLVNALQRLQRVLEVDVIILGRGGGSADELATFNDEALVRAVAACRVPIVSAVGHEIDVTLTDFAADARAATPSQAAEMVVPDARARRALLGQTWKRLQRSMSARLADERARLGTFARRLGDPRLAIASFQQTKDDRVSRLEASARRALSRCRERSSRAEQRLARLHPSARIAREQAANARAAARLSTLMNARLARGGRTLESLSARLDAMSPLKVLGRGYAIATRADGRALRGADDVAAGDRIAVRVHRARVTAEVLGTEETEDPKLSPRRED
jgi:exodeoxyribonuclease VII large subunit